MVILLLAAAHQGQAKPLAAQQQIPPARRVNVPYKMPTNQSAIFWFGQISNTSNHSNVRLTYNDDELIIWVHTFDRFLWFNPSPQGSELKSWDAISLYLNLGGNVGNAPTHSAYHFVAQFTPSTRARASYQLAFQGNGVNWSPAPITFATESAYRGSGYNNGAAARGWWVKFAIPFTSLGLSGKPDAGKIWGLSVVVHDRDDAAGAPIPNQIWPENALELQPATWGQLHFGLPNYLPPPAKPSNTITIRQGVNGNSVVDGHVGGHTVCGSYAGSWLEWGEANYAGDHQVNVHNQWDLADWPCYSRYYVTFPLGDIPPGYVIISAKLTLFNFGNAGQNLQPEPVPSFIQVFSVAEPWNEAELNWNNAPLALENWTGAWVNPQPPGGKWPGIPIGWNLGGAVAKAYAAGQPLRLALYSADTAYHSGRYFHSSDAGQDARPMLTVTWGLPFEPIGWAYIPTIPYQTQ